MVKELVTKVNPTLSNTTSMSFNGSDTHQRTTLDAIADQTGMAGNVGGSETRFCQRGQNGMSKSPDN